MSTFEPALTPEEAARRLGMNAEVIRRMCRDGRLPAAKIGRVWRIRPADREAMFGVWMLADRWGKSRPRATHQSAGPTTAGPGTRRAIPARTCTSTTAPARPSQTAMAEYPKVNGH